MTDPIGDMIARINNALMVKKASVSMPYSKQKEAIAKILVKQNYLGQVKIQKKEKRQYLMIDLLYKDGKSVIFGIKRISRPGRRLYLGAKRIKPVLSYLGLSLVSTSQGLMTDRQARFNKLGGEIILNIW